MMDVVCTADENETTDPGRSDLRLVQQLLVVCGQVRRAELS